MSDARTRALERAGKHDPLCAAMAQADKCRRGEHVPPRSLDDLSVFNAAGPTGTIEVWEWICDHCRAAVFFEGVDGTQPHWYREVRARHFPAAAPEDKHYGWPGVR